jgi:hypothetical protein
MSYRAMALVAAGLLFATQCYAETANINANKSNTFKQTNQTGGTKAGTAGQGTEDRSMTSYRKGTATSGGGAGAPADKVTKRCCVIYQPGHQGDDRYCSQSVPCP